MKSSKKDHRNYPAGLLPKLKYNLLLVALCSLGMLFVSCGDNSTGTNGGGGNGGNGGGNGNGGGSDEPTFTNVSNIFNGSCGGTECHISQRTSGVRLDSYDNVIGSVGDQYGEEVVQAEDAAGSPLVDKIEANPGVGERMPQGGPYLSDDEINLIRQWIDDGAEDN